MSVNGTLDLGTFTVSGGATVAVNSGGTLKTTASDFISKVAA